MIRFSHIANCWQYLCRKIPYGMGHGWVNCSPATARNLWDAGWNLQPFEELAIPRVVSRCGVDNQ